MEGGEEWNVKGLGRRGSFSLKTPRGVLFTLFNPRSVRQEHQKGEVRRSPIRGTIGGGGRKTSGISDNLKGSQITILYGGGEKGAKRRKGLQCGPGKLKFLGKPDPLYAGRVRGDGGGGGGEGGGGGGGGGGVGGGGGGVVGWGWGVGGVVWWVVWGGGGG